MADEVLDPKKSGKNIWLAEEILNHAEFLMDSSLSRQQRDRLARIRIASQGLIANLQRSKESEKVRKHQEKSVVISPLDAPLPSLHILLAEDNPFTQKLLSRMLTQNNHSVEIADNRAGGAG